MTVYISGPIRGIANDNAPGFSKAFNKLSKAGHNPISPIDIGCELKRQMGCEPTWAEYMREDIKALMDCDAIYMLSGWLESDGAKLEYQLSVEVGIKRIEL